MCSRSDVGARSYRGVRQESCTQTPQAPSASAGDHLRGPSLMGGNHYTPKLNKRRVLTHTDYTVYAVNGYAVRDAAQPDEEFGNFATRDEFPDLIPEGEIWISEKLAEKEGVFFIANALTQQARQAAPRS